MTYSRFEALTLTTGAAAVLASLFFSYGGEIVIEELLAQLLLLVVLFGAVHWGRTGGFPAALFASFVYIVMRIPLLFELENIGVEVVSLLVVRVLTYGLVGIVGGELCSRMKYIFARLEGTPGIDEWSSIYNQQFIVRALESCSAQFARYDTPYTVVLVELAEGLLSEHRPAKQRSFVRAVANHIRGDIRLIDEAGRLEDGRFCIVLPHTPRAGGVIVAERLRRGVCDVLGAADESVDLVTLGTPDDALALVDLRTSLVRQESGSAEEPQPAPSH